MRHTIILYWFMFHFAHWISCCPHSDHILPKLPAPDQRFSMPNVMVSTSDVSNLLLCLSHFIFVTNLAFSYWLNQRCVEAQFYTLTYSTEHNFTEGYANHTI